VATCVPAIGAIASILMLAASAETASKAKPAAAEGGAVALNPECRTQTGSRIAVNGWNCSAVVPSISRDDVIRNGTTAAGEVIRFNVPFGTINH